MTEENDDTGQLVALTLVSGNKKTGPIPTTMTGAASCPLSCPLRHGLIGGCYAAMGRVGMHWRAVSTGKRGVPFSNFVERVRILIPKGMLWRHNVAGDLQGDGRTIDAGKLDQLVKANKGKRGFTYTHYRPDVPGNARAIRDANDEGFTINLSGNSLKDADRLADSLAGPVVAIVPASLTRRKDEPIEAYRERAMGLTTPAGRAVVICPATYDPDVTCWTCGLCQRQRSSVVGFPSHGVLKAKADAVALQDEMA